MLFVTICCFIMRGIAADVAAPEALILPRAQVRGHPWPCSHVCLGKVVRRIVDVAACSNHPATCQKAAALNGQDNDAVAAHERCGFIPRAQLFPIPEFGHSADGRTVARIGDAAYAMILITDRCRAVYSGWRLAKPMSDWARSDFYGHGGFQLLAGRNAQGPPLLHDAGGWGQADAACTAVAIFSPAIRLRSPPDERPGAGQQLTGRMTSPSFPPMPRILRGYLCPSPRQAGGFIMADRLGSKARAIGSAAAPAATENGATLPRTGRV